jgi:hypothetical protein
MRLRWDTVGKKPKELLEKFAVPLRRKTLIFFDRGSPPLGTILTSSSLIVIAGSKATQQSTLQIAGLPRGACHRAGHFGPDSLARNHRRPSLLSHTSIQLAKLRGCGATQ